MKKNLLFLILFGMCAAKSFAQSTYAGTIVVGPTFNRPVSLTALSGVGTAVYYTVVPINVTATGSVIFTSTAVLTPGTVDDNFGIIYGTAGFNPASPLTNILALDDDAGVGSTFQITYNFTATGTYYLVVTTFNNATTGTFTVTTTSGAVLPVLLSSFKVSGTSSENLIQWSTEQELSVSGFSVERSENGVDFSDIATPILPNNHGSTATYSMYDRDPYNGVNYYRLRITNNDGSVKRSAIQSANNSISITAVYPNPAADYLVVLIPAGMAGKTLLAVRNSSGKAVMTKDISGVSGNRTRLEIKALSPGSYYVEIISGSGKTTVPFIKL